MSLTCEILSTGDEVLTGQITDTNATWLADQLGTLGFVVTRHTTVGDDRERLEAAFRELGGRADIVACTGGLGPTVDDLTTEIAAKVAGCGLKLDEPALQRMQMLWQARGRPMPENNRKQALLPELSEVLPNPVGTAPGFTMKLGRAVFFFMPGVPSEMKKMFSEQAVPRIEKLRPEPSIFQVRVLRTHGLPESKVDELLSGLEAQFPGVKLGFRAHFPEIQVKLTVQGKDAEATRQLLKSASREVFKRLGPSIFSDGPSMEETVGELLKMEKGTISLAESCTGGMIGEMLTSVPGSSSYFDRSFVTYTNAAKRDVLGVSEAILAEHGAVSETCARAMAEGARKLSGSRFALSATGIAGPTGGSPQKPVGTVFVALATPASTFARKIFFPGSRHQVRQITAMTALDMLRRHLTGLPVDGNRTDALPLEERE